MLTRAAAVAAGLLLSIAAPAGAQTRAFTISVDATLAPAVSRIAGAGASLPLGRIADASGTSAVVGDEIIVSTDSSEQLAGVLERWNGTLLESSEPDRPSGIVDHLVRIGAGPAPDPETVAADLQRLEPHDTPLRVDSAATLRLLGAMAHEATHNGVDVGLNWIGESNAIADGTLHEDPDAGNPFNWKYVASETAQGVGLDAAWQLLDAHGKLDGPFVEILVHDGGFKYNDDFPSVDTIRDAEWGDANPFTCTDGKPCPYHGTDVVLAAAGRHDNGYGTAGPAGPVARLVAAEIRPDLYRNFRRLKELVDEHGPDIVNMSYSFTSTKYVKHKRGVADRQLKRIVADGALLVAAAGNDSRDVNGLHLFTPCESQYVLCVGGLINGTISIAPGSNWGSADNSTSVELYGPWCTVGLTATKCGTSFSSPFLAGIAALVKAADPSLGAAEIRQILLETAHWGVSGAGPVGSQRRVNAAGAVARALGVTITDPVVKIDSPVHGKEYSVSSWVTLRGTATDFRGAALPIRWHSSLDGNLASAPKFGPVTVPGGLSVGTHTITATATDIRGVATSAKVAVKVSKQPPLVAIVAPAPGTQVYASEPLRLTARSMDPDAQWAPLPGFKVGWQIRRIPDMAVIAQPVGHDVTLPAGMLLPGAYSIRFRADLGAGATADDMTTVVVKPVPAGESVSKPTILAPTDGITHSTYKEPVTVKLRGVASDAQDGTLSGRRLRWVARAGEHEQVLCTGSSFPGASGDGFTSITDCSEVEAKLLPPPTAPVSQAWSIELEAADSAGLIGRTSRIITIRQVVP